MRTLLPAAALLTFWLACGDDDGGGGPPVDEIPPDTEITAGPMGDADIGSGMFTFSSEPDATYECRIDGAPFVTCTSPWTVNITVGDHVFEVRAIDAAGNRDETPAQRMYRGVAPTTGTRVRLVAANLTSGNLQGYEPGDGSRILKGLKPDIVMVQEFNYFPGNGTAEIRAWVDDVFGANFQFYREVGAQIPNGVVSRYPILAAGTWEDTRSPNREFVWARIDVPGPKDLWAVSVHLLTDDTPGTRDGEATELRALIEANVPASAYLVIGGDFNTDTRSEACVTVLSGLVSNGAPYPADQAGNSNTSAPRSKPYDWLMMNAALRATMTPVVIGANSFPNGLVFDSRVYTPLADVAPALVTDSAALNMQHQAVVVDVRLQ